MEDRPGVDPLMTSVKLSLPQRSEQRSATAVDTPIRCILVHMARTNIDIDDELVEIVMVRYHLKTKREAVDYALRHIAGQPMTKEEAMAMFGSIPDFEVPADRFTHFIDDDDDSAR